MARGGGDDLKVRDGGSPILFWGGSGGHINFVHKYIFKLCLEIIKRGRGLIVFVRDAGGFTYFVHEIYSHSDCTRSSIKIIIIPQAINYEWSLKGIELNQR